MLGMAAIMWLTVARPQCGHLSADLLTSLPQSGHISVFAIAPSVATKVHQPKACHNRRRKDLD